MREDLDVVADDGELVGGCFKVLLLVARLTTTVLEDAWYYYGSTHYRYEGMRKRSPDISNTSSIL